MFGRALVSPARALLLEERARIMRCSPTRSEEWLWRRLSGSKPGFAFRRQLVIGEHLADFACTEVPLVVEVDGGYHEGRERLDGARDRALGELGWTVLRVADESVIADLGGVVESIAETARRSVERAWAEIEEELVDPTSTVFRAPSAAQGVTPPKHSARASPRESSRGHATRTHPRSGTSPASDSTSAPARHTARGRRRGRSATCPSSGGNVVTRDRRRGSTVPDDSRRFVRRRTR